MHMDQSARSKHVTQLHPNSRGTFLHKHIAVEMVTGTLWVLDPQRGTRSFDLRELTSVTQGRRGGDYGIWIAHSAEGDALWFTPIFQGVQRASYQQIVSVDHLLTQVEVARQAAHKAAPQEYRQQA
jgi:hypothetical protein